MEEYDDYVEDVGQFYALEEVVYPHTLYKFRVTESSRGNAISMLRRMFSAVRGPCRCTLPTRNRKVQQK